MPKMFKSRYKLRRITVTGNDPLFPIDVVDCALGDFMGTRQGGAEGMLLTFHTRMVLEGAYMQGIGWC